MNLFKKIYLFLIDTVQSLLIAASFFLVIYIFIARPFQVSGDSMYPNFKNNEYILTNLISLKFAGPKRGDVVVFKAPPEPDKDFIKRVIGLPGDTVMIKNNNVYINGQILDESSFLKPDVNTFGGNFLAEGQTITVPKGEYFVMGDNRPYSSDSREWGFVPKANLIGLSFFAYWPPGETGLIKNPLSN